MNKAHVSVVPLSKKKYFVLEFKMEFINYTNWDGLTLNGISDTGSNSGFLKFTESKNLKELNKIL